MTRYIIRRLIQAIPTLFGITIISFLLISAVPGGVGAAFTGGNQRLNVAQKAAEVHRLGLDQPIYIQYFNWLSHFLQGDFGASFTGGRPVAAELSERIGATLELGALSLIVGLLIGVPLGIWAAVKQGGLFDNVTRILAVLISAIPDFWLGLMVILLFGATLHLLPMGSRTADLLVPLTGWADFIDRVKHLILPVAILASGGVAGYSRYLRASTLEISRQDYIRMAQAKGLRPRAVWFTHAARNAMIPLATFLGPSITGLLGGAVIVETVFSWPGLGQWAIEAVGNRNIPIVMLTVVLGGVATVLGYLLSDVLYVIIDPRIRYS